MIFVDFGILANELGNSLPGKQLHLEEALSSVKYIDLADLALCLSGDLPRSENSILAERWVELLSQVDFILNILRRKRLMWLFKFCLCSKQRHLTAEIQNVDPELSLAALPK